MDDESIEQEIACVENIVECLASYLGQIRIINDNTVEFNTRTAQQIIKCFTLLRTVIESDTDPSRINLLIFQHNPELIPTIMAYISIPVPRQPVDNLDEKLLNVKLTAIRTLTKLITICSRASEGLDQEEVEGSTNIAKSCAESIVREGGLKALFEILQKEQNDKVRSAIAETLFMFVVRNETGKLAVALLKSGFKTIIECLEKESVPMVRNYVCAIVREFSTKYSEELINEGVIEVCVNLINADPSPDVRALAAETLEVIFKSDVRALTKLEKITPALAEALNNRIKKDKNREVLESCCKVLETLFCLKQSRFTKEFIEIGGWQCFIRCLKNCSVRPASLAVRALRYLLQTAEPEYNLGYKIVTHFPSFLVLLKAANDQDDDEIQPQTQVDSITIAKNLLKVELALTLGLIFASSPMCRQHVHHELKSFPMWMFTLRSSLLKAFSFAEIEYFSDVAIIDSTGVNLLKVFNIDIPRLDALKHLYKAQHTRSAASVDEEEINFENVDPFISELLREKECKTQEDWNKIKLLIICYAVFLTVRIPTIGKPQQRQVEIKEEKPKKKSPQVAHSWQNEPRQPEEPKMVLRQRKSPKLMEDSPKPILKKPSPSTKNILSTSDDTQLPKLPTQTPSMSLGDTIDIARSPDINNDDTLPYYSPDMSRMFGRRDVSVIKKRRSPRKQNTRFETAMHTIRAFSQYYQAFEKEARKSKPISPSKTWLKQNYVAAGDGLVLRSFRLSSSPTKMIKSWTDTDVKEVDLFEFSLPFEEISVSQLTTILLRAKKHHKTVKKHLITCPQSINAKGRKTLLIDMNNNVMPRVLEALEELIQLERKQQLKFLITMWKGKYLNKDTTLNPGNLPEILEFVKAYVATQETTPSNIKEENQYAQNVTQLLQTAQQNAAVKMDVSEIIEKKLQGRLSTGKVEQEQDDQEEKTSQTESPIKESPQKTDNQTPAEEQSNFPEIDPTMYDFII